MGLISFGKREWIPQLKQLWKRVFGDTDAYLDAFFKHQYKEENTLVYLDDNKVVAALYMIPYKMRIASEVVDVTYLYALSTDPAYRGKGIMAGLIEKSFELAYERGYVLSTLIPAGKGLFDYYRRFDFETCFDKSEVKLDLPEITKIKKLWSPLNLQDASADEVWDIYAKTYFLADKCVLLNRGQNSFNIDQLVKGGGKAVSFIMKGDLKGYALIGAQGKQLHIHQCLVGRDFIAPLISALAHSYSFDEMVFTQPSYFQIEGARKTLSDFAMARVIRVDKAAKLLAKEHKNMSMHLKIYDRLLSQNDGGYEIFGENIREIKSGKEEYMNLGLLAQILTGYRTGNLQRRENPDVCDYFPSPTPYMSMTLM